MAGMDVDAASLNFGKLEGLRHSYDFVVTCCTLFQLELEIHCWNFITIRKFNFAAKFGELASKLIKAHRRRWLNCKGSTMRIDLENYDKYIDHRKEVPNNSEFQGFFKKWARTPIPSQLAIYFDILSSIPSLSLGIQNEKHDRVE